MAKCKTNVYFCVVDDVTTPILDSLRQARLPVKIWVPADDNGYRVSRHTRDIAEITCDNIIQRYPGCYRWDIGESVTSVETDGLDHMLARIKEYDAGFVCVDNRPHPCGQLVLFHDCHYRVEYPDAFCKVKAFDSYETLEHFIVNLPDEFSLDDESRFNRTNYVVQGQTVRYEFGRRRHWYLDNLHKDHYEVFDHNGDHLGEADLDGVMRTDSRDPNKKLDFKKMGR